PYKAKIELREQRLKILAKEAFHDLGDQISTTVLVSTDTPHEAILNYNLNNPQDLIVMSTVGRTGIDYLMMGSTAANVVRNLKSPLLSINPKQKADSFILRNALFSRLHLLIILALTHSLGACSTNSNPPADEEEKPPAEELTPIASVAPDGILEAVTWNVEWYGANNQGPSDDFQQSKNVLRIVDSLDADLYAFQEISSQQALTELTNYMTDYEGLVADYISYNQKMAFVYNANTIEIIESGYISKSDVRTEFQDQWNYYWANGRMPFFVNFRYTINDTKSK